jgi:hypothetical protein
MFTLKKRNTLQKSGDVEELIERSANDDSLIKKVKSQQELPEIHVLGANNWEADRNMLALEFFKNRVN